MVILRRNPWRSAQVGNAQRASGCAYERASGRASAHVDAQVDAQVDASTCAFARPLARSHVHPLAHTCAHTFVSHVGFQYFGQPYVHFSVYEFLDLDKIYTNHPKK